MLVEMSARTSTRFIAITHNPVTMARMDRLLGVTCPSVGVSQLVSVDLRRPRPWRLNRAPVQGRARYFASSLSGLGR